MTVAILSPHLDDAVLSCWHLLEGRGALTVVNVFAGSPPPGACVPPWDRLTGATDPVARMGARREEDRRALALVSRDAVNLDLLDVQYAGCRLSPGRLAGRLRALLEPGSVVYAPAGLSGHLDHELVRDAALALALAPGIGQVVLYADLPHGIGRGWPAWVGGEPRPGVDVGADWDDALTNAGLTVERLLPRVRPLDAAARARKLRALAEYRTQRAALDGLAFVPLDDPRALAFEVTWVVAPSALGRPDERRSEALVRDGPSKPLPDRG